MIDYITYTIDGKTYKLTSDDDNNWSRNETAPSVAGNYELTFTISENGIISTVDSSNSIYETYLQVVVETERVVYLEDLVPDNISEIEEFQTLFKMENENLDDLYANIGNVKSDAFIKTASEKGIKRREDFIGIKGSGTLNQRKSYLVALRRKGKKLNEEVIKSIVNTITGSDCIITFFGADEPNNPFPGDGLIKVQVLSPDNTIDYRYDDISRALIPLVPGHLDLKIVKYFALWEDVKSNFADWTAVKSMTDWQMVRDYKAPE